MSKYNALWEYVSKESDGVRLSFERIKEICGFPIDHSFLNFKKELKDYGWSVLKISLKGEYVDFVRDKQ